MADGTLFAIGCGVMFLFAAGVYVLMRAGLSPNEDER